MTEKEKMEVIWKKIQEICKKGEIKVILVPEFKRK